MLKNPRKTTGRDSMRSNFRSEGGHMDVGNEHPSGWLDGLQQSNPFVNFIKGKSKAVGCTLIGNRRALSQRRRFLGECGSSSINTISLTVHEVKINVGGKSARLTNILMIAIIIGVTDCFSSSVSIV